MPLVSVPSPANVYPNVLAATAMSLTRICGILTEVSLEYKEFVSRADDYASGFLPYKPAVDNIASFNL